MSTTRLELARAIFEEALSRASENRHELVRAACAGDDELRSEVESLLQHHGHAPAEFLQPPERPRQSTFEAQPLDALIGQNIGQFRIKSLISAGGMGTVYLAEQPSLRRDVAVKVMRPGTYAPSVLRRFEHEALVLASLRHPNIAQVYEAGIADVSGEGSMVSRPGAETKRVPFFAMEYVRSALTITDYANRQELTVRQRLELFAPVCDAVEYGHRKGVIHRDLKPGNILVADEKFGRDSQRSADPGMDSRSDHSSPITHDPSLSSATPKVIDFGIARSTDADIALTTVQTQVGELMGTLQYMSPEQCDADPHDLDTRTDVYSLGVVLYELLTSALPYHVSGTTIFRATQIIKTQEPRLPSEARRELRGDVETIVMKAMKKDRRERYQSAADLARDIRRHLNHEPIEARPPSTWNRAARWIVRHPAWTTAAACAALVVVTVAATLASVWVIERRPYKVQLADDRQSARLFTVARTEIYEWAVRPPGLIQTPTLVDRPEEFGGGQLVVMALSHASADGYPSGLYAFSAQRDYSRFVWRGDVGPANVPAARTEHVYNSEDFGPAILLVEDVFPDPLHPGLEIVAQHVFGPFSQTVFRVYGLEGTVLYQFWHDGPSQVSGCYWLKGAGLLVFLACNAEVDPRDRGIVGLMNNPPRVLFAVRPRLGVIGETYLTTEPRRGSDQPIWYKAVRPFEALDQFAAFELGSPSGNFDAERCVRLHLAVSPSVVEGAGLWFVVDEHGEVAGPREFSDMYRRNLDKLPDPHKFGLGDLPGILQSERKPDAQDTSPP